MTVIQLAALLALAAIGLGMVISASMLVSAFVQFRREQTRRKSLIERLEKKHE